MKMLQMLHWILVPICLVSLQISDTEAFSGERLPTGISSRSICFSRSNPEEDQNPGIIIEDEEEEKSLSEADARLSDILPPSLSFSRNSVLFSEKPVTQRNNEVLTFWRGMKSMVPPVITGAWPWRDPFLADENPMGAFYNICFVRLPVIFMGLVYAKNLKEGHPLIMDYGDGPFEVSPLIVLGVLAIVLA